ncbi:FAD binding domain-containing protein [Desulfurococcus mucosus]|uniref:Molybdopterin dehydrogenase FAD-binding protein n=1 Tax=Desulfurococcus mucosus (strain ATCC 35584 / DSM 2162 / JCM 9187 / O7/1) TaxID=765177 RepID=E8R8L6_DESM0|nr:xanthine dehydrogenase family protein subunit M [Desulfurococcus mucosus]ADV64842.1 molybdopterin dehydrogenase FAD-binding protein [Desulfurococcus mucosus DSM 2162]
MFYRIPEVKYHRPASLEEALELLGKLSGKARILAGGTDLVLDLKIKRYDVSDLIDVSGLKELKYITDEGGVLRIGALTTIQEIADSTIVAEKTPLLKKAAEEFAYWQVRNIATIGGNLCNASPAADTAPPLMVHEAWVRAVSMDGERRIPLKEFFKGPRTTALKPNEILAEVSIPYSQGEAWRYAYHKLGRRRGHDISVVSIAVAVRVEEGVFRDVRIALGSVAPTPVRAWSVEEELKGREASVENINRAVEKITGDIKPISDARASAEYRLHVSKELLRDMLTGLVEGGRR